MFKHTKIAMSAVLLAGMGCGQDVAAVAVDESGTSAQVLIFPYYNVNNNFQTTFEIRNSKNDYKAVKLRFRESKYSNDVLDFGIYMSPYDVFTLALVKDADGKARMLTTDRTCTHPVIPSQGVQLKGDFYTHTNDVTTLEGYLEVIEMGVVEDGKPLGANNTMYEGIKHIPAGANGFVPKDCSVVSTAWKTGYFTQGGAYADVANFTIAGKTLAGFYSNELPDNPTPGIPDHIFAPTGGLSGYAVLIDIAQGSAYEIQPVALRNYQHTHAQHYLSYDPDFQLLPSFASGNDTTSVIARDDGKGSVVNNWSFVQADWGLSDPFVAPDGYIPSGINPFPIADVLAATGVQNDYFTNTFFTGATDWILSFPMRKHGIFNNYRFGGNTNLVPATPTTPQIAAIPRFSPLSPAFSQDVKFNLELRNREEQSFLQRSEVLDKEVNVLSFVNANNPSVRTVTGSTFAKQIIVDNAFNEGFGQLYFDGPYSLAALGNNGWLKNLANVNTIGVPVVGFALIRGTITPNSQNTIGDSIPHVYTRIHGNKDL